MYHQKFDLTAAIPVTTVETDSANGARRLDRGARVFSAMIVLGLPLVLLWLLARFLWNDVKAVARGIAIFYRAAAEELLRP
jgi:flagellar biogenesis protein FliO